MKLPRRPVLAVCCAVLLVATAGMWVRSQFRHDRADVRPLRNGRSWSIATGQGTLFVGWSASVMGMAADVSRSSLPLSDGLTIGWFDWRMPEGPRWSGYVDVPLWFVALLPAAGLWWSFRRPRKRTRGFAVEAAAAASISTPEQPRAA